jgi:hypothetical protein
MHRTLELTLGKRHPPGHGAKAEGTGQAGNGGRRRPASAGIGPQQPKPIRIRHSATPGDPFASQRWPWAGHHRSRGITNWEGTGPGAAQTAADQTGSKPGESRSRAISAPLTGVSSGISQLLTDNYRARSARSRQTNTSLCKQVFKLLPGPLPPYRSCSGEGTKSRGAPAGTGGSRLTLAWYSASSRLKWVAVHECR